MGIQSKIYIVLFEFILFLGILNGFSIGMQVASADINVVQNNEISLNDLSAETSDFYVNITSVGTTPSILNKLEPIQANVYEVKSNTIITQIVIKFDVSGFTSWNLGEVDIPGISESVDFGTSTTTLGHVFIQVDNLVYSPSVDAAFDVNYGFSVPVSQGDHTISVLYIGYGEDGIHFSYDSVVVRIAVKNSDFLPYVLHKYILNPNVTDIHESKLFTKNIVTHDAFDSTNIFIDKTKNFVYLRNDEITPTGNIEFGYNNSTDVSVQYGEAYLVLPDVDKFNLNGIVNTTGITGLQILGQWMTQPGMTFFVDALGLHTLDGLEDVYLRNGNNYVGLFTLAPYGMWHKKIPGLDGSNWEGREYGMTDWILGNIAQSFDSSFDFMSVTNGLLFNFFKYDTFETETKDTPGLLLFGTMWTIMSIMILNRNYKRRLEQ